MSVVNNNYPLGFTEFQEDRPYSNKYHELMSRGRPFNQRSRLPVNCEGDVMRGKFGYWYISLFRDLMVGSKAMPEHVPEVESAGRADEAPKEAHL